MRVSAFIAMMLLAGCTTMRYMPAAQQTQSGPVRVLYEYPQDGKFKSLGTIEAYHYQPGWSAPKVGDALPELKSKAGSVGGNALIVRSHQVGQFDRSISVTAEVLLIESTD